MITLPANFRRRKKTLEAKTKAKQNNMSASKNPDAMTSAQGEFRSKVAPSEPLTTKGVSNIRTRGGSK